jgi:hypothetical protein
LVFLFLLCADVRVQPDEQNYIMSASDDVEMQDVSDEEEEEEEIESVLGLDGSCDFLTSASPFR